MKRYNSSLATYKERVVSREQQATSVVDSSEEEEERRYARGGGLTTWPCLLSPQRSRTTFAVLNGSLCMYPTDDRVLCGATERAAESCHVYFI